MSTRTELVAALDERLQALEKESPGLLDDELAQGTSIETLVDELTGPLMRRVLQEEVTRDLGPYYDTAGLMRRWRVSRQAVSKRHTSGSLLALTSDDGRLLFPIWQFKPGTADYPIPLEALAEVRDILAERNTDPLSQAIWLTAKVFGSPESPLPAYRLLADARGARMVRSAARSEVLRLAEGGSDE